MIKAIQTYYGGYKFRSKLEARWAVFFDALKIKWEYELEGYQLSDGRWYLPDFYLPYLNGGIYVEVKPDENYDDKAFLFGHDISRHVLMAVGTPCIKIYDMYHHGHDWVTNVVFNTDFIKKDNHLYQLPQTYEEMYSIELEIACNIAKQYDFTKGNTHG